MGDDREKVGDQGIARRYFARGWMSCVPGSSLPVTNVYIQIPPDLLDEFSLDELFEKVRDEYTYHARVNTYIEVNGITHGREESHNDRCILENPFTLFGYGEWQDDRLTSDVIYKRDVVATAKWGVFRRGMKIKRVEIDLRQSVVNAYLDGQDEAISQRFTCLPRF